VIISVQIIEGNGEVFNRIQSFIYKDDEIAHVTKIESILTEKAEREIRVTYYTKLIPEIGDKFSSTNGQKGTIGMIYSEEDLPFDSQGLPPDIIVSPFCIPSRMTLGQLYEMVSGNDISSKSLNKYCPICVEYKRHLKNRCEFDCILTQYIENYIYSTPFYSELIPKHFKDIQGQIFYDGRTGKKLNTLVFDGFIYYQRLKHLAADKLYSRTTGPLQVVTRQPREGRSVDGGHRFGTMERDNAGSHGVMNIIKERLCDQSDKTTIRRCRECGIFDHKRPSEISFDNSCKLCGKDTIVETEIPYGSKAFIQLASIYNMKLELLS
jgi:DNA-directed RNA polymerase beta subunit